MTATTSPIKTALIDKLKMAVDNLNAAVASSDLGLIDEGQNEVDMVLEEMEANGIVMYPTAVENVTDDLKDTTVTFRFDTGMAPL